MKGLNELKGLSKSELDKKLEEVNLELIKLNGQVSTGTNPKSPSQIKVLRRTIARIKTLSKDKK